MHPIIKNSSPAVRYLTPEQLIDETKRGEKLTRWVNPSNHVLRADLYIEGGQILLEGVESEDGRHVGRTFLPTRYCRVEVPPGGSVELPASLDNGIHQKDKHGVVVGGLMPQLRRVDATGEPLVFAAGVA